MKHIFLIILAFIPLELAAQAFSVAFMNLLEQDVTANSYGSRRLDRNGDVAALIKIETSEVGFTFENGSLGIVDVVQKNGEIWLYLPKGSQRLTIKHPRLGILRNYRFPIVIESARTYIMRLTSDKVETIVKTTVKQKHVIFNVSPPGALVSFDGVILETDANGKASRFVSFGNYPIVVEAYGYHTIRDTITVKESGKPTQVTVKLPPAFGAINIGGTNVDGANVYLDNELRGTAPILLEHIPSGKHDIKLIKSGYHPIHKTISLTDNTTIPYNPIMTVCTSPITFTVDKNAEIWINGEYRGKGTISDNFPEGAILIECRLEGCTPTVKEARVQGGMQPTTIKLQTPAAITGVLVIHATPIGANVYIDDILVGTAPSTFNNIQVGNRHIRIAAPGYTDHVTDVDISEITPTTINASLVKAE